MKKIRYKICFFSAFFVFSHKFLNFYLLVLSLNLQYIPWTVRCCILFIDIIDLAPMTTYYNSLATLTFEQSMLVSLTFHHAQSD